MSKSSNLVLDNGLPRSKMPWRSESGRFRSKAESVVIMRNPCQIGTWNVRTMLVEEKIEEIKKEMERLNIDILGICETRWGGSGDYWDDDFRIIYTGGKQGANGTAIVLNKKWGNLVDNTIHHSDRITAVKIRSHPVDTLIVQTYMPTGSYDDEEVETIYNDLDSILDVAKEKENLIVMGDFNAVVGEGAHENIVGKFGLGKRNKRGDRLVQFCKENNLIVSNTYFELPKRRLYTWKMPGDLGRYQIDYILVKSRHRNQITVCKTYPGADLNTDHNLLLSKYNFDMKKQKRRNKPKKLDLKKLHDKDSDTDRVQFSNNVGNKLTEYKSKIDIHTYNKFSVNEKWGKVRDIVRSSAEECLRKEKIVPRKSWLTKEITDLMLERRKLRNKSDHQSIQEYKRITNKITTKCRECKENDTVKICEKIDEYLQKGQMDKAYNIIRSLSKNHTTKSTTILDETGKLLIDNNDILHRWIRYIEKLYEGQGLHERDIEEEQLVEEDEKGPAILKEEFVKALMSIHNGKAAGNDQIYIEMIKYAMCEPFTKEIFDIMQDIYTTGQVPLDFQISKTVTLPKKLNTAKCEEFRTLSLISQASKIILKIIQNRLRPIVEKQLGPDQYGFRQNKGTREAILALRLVADRRLELNLDTHIAFIDLEKAFDKVDWKMMMEILSAAGVDYRDRKIIYELYRNQETVIEIGEEKGKAKIRQGVRQGCPLSPLIFNLFIEQAIRKVDSDLGGVKINGCNIQFIRFADDIAALAENSNQLQELVSEMDTIFNEFGLKINSSKTKTMTISKHTPAHLSIKLQSNTIEQVTRFKYLGSLITSDSRCTEDIIQRIAMAKKAFNSKKHLLKGKMSKKAKKQLIKVYIWSIALYGSETWTLTQRDRERLEAFEMWCWRRMESISWTEKKTNEEVLSMVKEDRCLLKTIQNRRGRMIGHLMRHDAFFVNILEGKVNGKRGRGRPRITFFSQVKEKVGTVSYQETKTLSRNREEWRLLHRQELSS